MSFLRTTIGFVTVTAAILCAQSAGEMRVKETGLKKSLMTLRQAIDEFTFEQHRAPQRLQDLITKGYVNSIPTDPMTGTNGAWRVVMEEPAKSADRNAPGIFDVYSSSDGVSTDGTRYAEW
jgi:general secretion pathway protein G